MAFLAKRLSPVRALSLSKRVLDRPGRMMAPRERRLAYAAVLGITLGG